MDEFRPQYTVRALLFVTASVAGVLGLARWLAPDATWVLAIPLGAIPLSLILEAVFSRRPIAESQTSLASCARSHAVLIAPAILVAFAAYSSVRALTPFLTILALFFETPTPILLAIPMATFWMLTFYLGRAPSPQPMPSRFPIVLAIATAFTVLWLGLGWSVGIQYHGWSYTVTIVAINVVWVAILWLLWFAFRHRASRAAALTFTTLLFCWLYWFAFPWLGEVL